MKEKTEKQVEAIKSLDPCNKLKQIEVIFPPNFMNDLNRPELKEIAEFQKTIKKMI